jgi:hypothetical protein
MSLGRRLVLVALVLVAAAQWRALRAMKSEIARMRREQPAELSRLAAAQFSEDRRDEFRRTVTWLDAFYAAPEGLGRAGGLCRDNRLDRMAAELLFDPYLRARVGGASEEAARQRMVDAIKATAEWQARHP